MTHAYVVPLSPYGSTSSQTQW